MHRIRAKRPSKGNKSGADKEERGKMLYHIKLSHPEDTYLENIINRNGLPHEIRYTSDISSAKVYDEEQSAKTDAEIIPVILPGVNGSVILAT